MRLSYYTHTAGLSTSTGYGYAGYNIVSSLEKLGHRVIFDDPAASVQLMFTQPQDFVKRESQHAIGYTPWESTELNPGWEEYIRLNTDEFWTTSPLNRRWFEDLDIFVSTVFPHGITHNWTSLKRKPKKKIRFLSVGEPAPRKCGQMVFDAFIELFGNDERYQLTLKSDGPITVRYDPSISGFLARPDHFSNVRIIESNISEEEMVSLYHSHDVLLYPSWGEGFGFIALQGLATGMPTIFNPTWAPYAHYSRGLEITDSLADSPWPHIHPGKMLEPSKESLKARMLDVVENFDVYSETYFGQAAQIHEEFDWVNQTRTAFEPIVK